MLIDYSKYPDNWNSEIRPRILERADNRCEFCNVENYQYVFRGLWHNEEVYQYADGRIYAYPSYKAGEISFLDLYKNQVLLYMMNGIYPYRDAFKVIKEVKSINYVEFLFGIYSLQVAEDEDYKIKEVVNRILQIRKLFPNIAITSSENQEKVEKEINQLHPVGFKSKDIWTDRTTTGNQYRYFLNHLSVFDTIFKVDFKSKELFLISNKEKEIDRILTLSTPEKGNFSDNYGYFLWVDKI